MSELTHLEKEPYYVLGGARNNLEIALAYIEQHPPRDGEFCRHEYPALMQCMRKSIQQIKDLTDPGE